MARPTSRNDQAWDVLIGMVQARGIFDSNIASSLIDHAFIIADEFEKRVQSETVSEPVPEPDVSQYLRKLTEEQQDKPSKWNQRLQPTSVESDADA